VQTPEAAKNQYNDAECNPLADKNESRPGFEVARQACDRNEDPRLVGVWRDSHVYVWFDPIPRLSKAGMPSRSDGWGGLFKDESTDG
jgi:hypothetical protein